jgi:hypothetical protein
MNLTKHTTQQTRERTTQRVRRLALALALGASAALTVAGNAGVAQVAAGLDRHPEAQAWPPGPSAEGAADLNRHPEAGLSRHPEAQAWPPGPSTQDTPPGTSSPTGDILAI